jgi:hypothetical protein
MSATDMAVDFGNAAQCSFDDSIRFDILYELICVRQPMSDLVLGTIPHRYVDGIRQVLVGFKEVTDAPKSEEVSVRVAFSGNVSLIYEFSWIVARGIFRIFQCHSLMDNVSHC